MRHRSVRFARYGLLAVAMAALPLAACSSTGEPGFLSTFGGAELPSDGLPSVGNYTADKALAEARAHFRNKDFGYSAALYKRVVELSPKDPEGYIGLGASYDHLRRFDLSDRVYAALYKLTGGTAQYYNNIGYSNLLRGNLKVALTNLRKAKQLDPNNAVVANNLAMLAKLAAKARA